MKQVVSLGSLGHIALVCKACPLLSPVCFVPLLNGPASKRALLEACP